MTLTCTNVTLRQKALRNDRISLYLDYYPAIRNPYTMKMSRSSTRSSGSSTRTNRRSISLLTSEQRHASDTKSGTASVTISKSSAVVNVLSEILPLNYAKSSEIIS